MLQYRAALCQPKHARLAHFAWSFRSQFPLQPVAAPCKHLTETRAHVAAVAR